MNKISLLFLVSFFFLCQFAHGQTTQFKTYTNTKDKFSFDIPAYWDVKYSKEEYGFICVPVTTAEKTRYKDCFEGIVFRLSIYNSALEASLVNDGYTKTGNTYFTSDKVSNHVKTENISGKNWKGIYHNNVCGINCKVSGSRPSTGKCQFLYFSNGKTTVSIATNGKEFSQEILNRLKSSFRFM